jgi:glutathione S-transferase
MKLFFSPTSPYVRKCMAVACELQLDEQIELLPSSAHPINRDQTIIPSNPLGKVPTLVTGDGMALYDSRVICEYLNALGKGDLFPASGAPRWEALTLQALGDGIMDAALLARYEGFVRPEGMRWPEWQAGQMDKIETSLRQLDQHPQALASPLNIGQLTLGCALWYLSLRFPELDWKARFPALAAGSQALMQRTSMTKTWALVA